MEKSTAEKNIPPYKTEVCKAVTRTFYATLDGGRMVYVTVCVQKMPESAQDTKGAWHSIGQYMKDMPELMDTLDWGID